MRLWGLTWQGYFALGPNTEVRARRSRGWAAAWILAGAAMLAAWIVAGTGAWVMPAGAGMIVLGAWMWRDGIDVALGDGVIRVRRLGLLGGEAFEEPFAAYRGVCHTTSFYQQLKVVFWAGRPVHPWVSDVVVQRIELVHRERAWTVPIYQSVSTGIPRREWEDYATRFGLPLLIEDGDRVVERAPGDLDKTLKKLAHEDRLPEPTSGGPPPWPFRVDAGDKLIVVTLRRPAAGWVWVALAAALPVIVLVKALGDGQYESFLRVMFFFAVFMAPAVWLASIRRQLRIHRTRLEWVLKFPFFDGRVKDKIGFRSIEQVSVHKVRGRRKPLLLISGDKRSLALKTGLGRRHLEWLRDYITAAIVTS